MPGATISPSTDRTGMRRSLAEYLQRPWAWAGLCLAAALPLLFLNLLPLTDFGGHLGRFTVQLDGGRSAELRQWYSFHWALVPNLGTDLLMQALGPYLGLEPTLGAIVKAIAPLQVAGFIALARVAHGRVPPTALFALPLAYSYAFHFGFLNFTLSTALATCALALWLHLGNRRRDRLRWALFVPIAAALWVTHLAGWACFCVLAGGIELMREDPDAAPGRPVHLARCALRLSCLLSPLLLMALWPSGGGSGTTAEFFNLIQKAGLVLQVYRDRWAVWDIGSALLTLVLLIWFYRSSAFARHNGLALGALILGGLYLLVPHVLFGSWSADMRLVPMVLAMALIAVRPGEKASARLVGGLTVVALVFVGARFVGNAISLRANEQVLARSLTVLDAVPRNASLVTLVLRPCAEETDWAATRSTHLAGYALARRHAFANDQWMIPGGQLLRIHNPAAEPFASDPSQHVSDTECDYHWTFANAVAHIPPGMSTLWVVGEAPIRSLPGWREIARSEGSAVYARNGPTP